MAAARGRPKAELLLSTEERLTLERLANRRKSAQALAMRARIVMACATGDTNRAVAEKLGVSQAWSASGAAASWSTASAGSLTSRGRGPEDNHR